MARLAWTYRATRDLNEIAEFVAYDNPEAALRLVGRIYAHVEQLEQHPKSGSVVPEHPHSEYRQIVEPPCRVFYKINGETVYVVHVMRSERILKVSRLEDEE